MKSIWIKINNKNDKPEEWIRQGYISISKYDRNNIENSLQWLEDRNGTYNFVTKLNIGDIIYIFMIKNGSSLLKYKFECNSDYISTFHGYYIKTAYKCLDEINQFDSTNENNANMRQKWAAPKNFNLQGKIIKKCINSEIHWQLIKNYEIDNNINKEMLDNDEHIEFHKCKEGRIIEQKVMVRSRLIKLMDAYLQKYGYRCQLCGNYYLKANGTDYIIDVHHINPIANGERQTNIDTDLKGLCPNCHRFVHSIDNFENKSWDKIKEIFNRVNNINQ